MSNFITLMDQLMDDAYFPSSSSLRRRMSTVPAVNVDETDQSFIVSMAANDIDADKVDIEVHEKTLTIHYQNEEKKEEELKSLRQEFVRYSSFERSFILPKNIDAEGISADYTKGILKITVPKSPEAQPKKVKVSSAE